MITFWIVAVIFVVIGLAILLLPFYKKEKDIGKKVDQTDLNISIAKERLTELDAELADKRLDQDEYDEMKKELEGALYFDLADQNKDEKIEKKGAWAFIVIAIFVPLLSVSMYLSLGSPEGMKLIPGQRVSAVSEEDEMGSINTMVKSLIEKLKKNPNDIQGWTILARTMMNLEQFKEAVVAFRKVLEISNNDEMALVSLADALAMSNNGDLTGEPEILLQKALDINENNITALWLLGMAADDKGDPTLALSYWKKLYPKLDDADEAKASLASLINNAQKKLGNNSQISPIVVNTPKIANQSSVVNAQLKVRVMLDDSLKGSITGNELVFIYAKAMVGPPMPLAAKKISVQDLPISLTLDDSMAMMPDMKISSFKQFKVGARISKSGQPIAQAGDLYGEVSNVMVTNDGTVINISISQIK